MSEERGHHHEDFKQALIMRFFTFVVFRSAGHCTAVESSVELTVAVFSFNGASE
jgi:hypothetical protein